MSSQSQSREDQLHKIKDLRNEAIYKEIRSSLINNFLRPIFSKDNIDISNFPKDEIYLKILPFDDKKEAVLEAFESLSQKLSSKEHLSNLIPLKVESVPEKIEERIFKYFIPLLLVKEGIHFKIDMALNIDKRIIMAEVFKDLCGEVLNYE